MACYLNALSLLFSIENDPENLAAINALAAMGILTEDENLIDAALSEILALPREQRAQMDPAKEVDYLLLKHHQGLVSRSSYGCVHMFCNAQLDKQDQQTQAMSLAQRAIVAEPSDSEARVRLATLKMEEGDVQSVLSIISGSSSATIEVESVEAGLRAIARAKVDEQTALREAQRAIMFAPWDSTRWLALAFVRNSGSH